MKKWTALLTALMLVLTLLTACGGSSKSQAADYAMPEMAAAEAPAALASGSNGLREESAETGTAALPENRKWIVTVNMQAETEDMDALLAELDRQILALDGYVENQNIYNGSAYATRRHRNANLTVRIPAGEVDAFAREVEGMANVTSRDVRREDITLTYVATESKVTALKTEEARLLELLARAENMSDLLEIEARLSDVRYELENHSSRLRLYDNQVDYATVYMYISEVQEYTPVAEKTPWEQIRDGFAKSVKGVTEGIVDTVVWILANSPYLVVWGLVLGAAVLMIRKARKGWKIPGIKLKRKQKKEEKS